MAFALFSVAGITDLLDGYIARNFQNQQSVLGSFLDPFADKLLVATLFATLTYTGNIPVPLTAVILLRDVLLISGAAYLRYKSLPAPRKISRYFDFKYATVQISPTTISKINTAFQLSVVASTLTACLFGFVGHPFVTCLYWTTAGTTVASGIIRSRSKKMADEQPEGEQPPSEGEKTEGGEAAAGEQAAEATPP
ncbi:putative cardiolipin synthase (CMP-forming)-like protein, partial [Dinothrombium tinctorium]